MSFIKKAFCKDVLDRMMSLPYSVILVFLTGTRMEFSHLGFDRIFLSH